MDFDTTRAVYPTDPVFCHVSHVVADTESWEQKMTQALEELGEEGLLISYVKNQSLGFSIPYTINGEQHNYNPDFIARLNDGRGKDDPLNLIIEVIEHRLFCHITRNWQGVPLEDLTIVVNLIGSTKTEEGLEVHAWLDCRQYEKSRKVTEAQLSKVRIKRNKFHGDWNYKILPSQ